MIHHVLQHISPLRNHFYNIITLINSANTRKKKKKKANKYFSTKLCLLNSCGLNSYSFSWRAHVIIAGINPQSPLILAQDPGKYPSVIHKMQMALVFSVPVIIFSAYDSPLLASGVAIFPLYLPKLQKHHIQ